MSPFVIEELKLKNTLIAEIVFKFIKWNYVTRGDRWWWCWWWWWNISIDAIQLASNIDYIVSITLLLSKEWKIKWALFQLVWRFYQIWWRELQSVNFTTFVFVNNFISDTWMTLQINIMSAHTQCTYQLVYGTIVWCHTSD